MKKIFALLLALMMSLPAAGCVTEARFSSDTEAKPAAYYTSIPGVTEDEIAAIETFKASGRVFSYAHLNETEAFVLPDGKYAGFTIKLCDLLTELFGISFIHTPYDEWENMINDHDAGAIDFMGCLIPTPERTEVYHMTYPIAQRTLSVFTLDPDALKTEADVNGIRLGAFKGTITAENTKKYYPVSFETVYFDTISDAAGMLKSSEIDAFIMNSVMDPSIEPYDYIYSKELFPLAYSPVSMSTSVPELAPVISVMNKYILSGGIDLLDEMYKESDEEYARYKMSKLFTDEEKAYLADMAATGSGIATAFETDNYPVSFYNIEEHEFQGIAVDVLKKIEQLIDIKFEAVTTKDEPWAKTFEKLKSGEASMVTQLLYTDSRKGDYLWSGIPYDTTYYALLSKADYPALEIPQVIRSKVGLIDKTAYADTYYEWFGDVGNTTTYKVLNDGLDALERGDIDLLMATKYALLAQVNYREKSGYKINIMFNTKTDSMFGFNKNEELLCGIIDKAMAFVNTGTIAADWNTRAFDYERKMQNLRFIYLLAFAVLLAAGLLTVVSLLIKNRRLARDLAIDNKLRKAAEEEARISSSAKSAFLNRINHEIRTPLNSIIGMAGIAKSAASNPDKVVSSINYVLSSSNQLLDTINDVLDMSKIESGNLALLHEPFCLADTCSEITESTSVRCSKKSISFTSNISSLSRTILIGDSRRLTQVLKNLLDNAVKFAGKPGTIAFSVDIQEETEANIKALFSVSNNGARIPDEQIDKLFLPFEKTYIAGDKSGGIGLGLSIAQCIVQKMGGNIEVDNGNTVGTTFRFELSFKKA